MRLKSKPTFIRTGDEPAPKRPFKVGRFVYVGFLLLLLVFLAIKLGGSFFYIRGVGQIEASRLNVQELTVQALLTEYRQPSPQSTTTGAPAASPVTRTQTDSGVRSGVDSMVTVVGVDSAAETGPAIPAPRIPATARLRPTIRARRGRTPPVWCPSARSTAPAR